MNASSHVSESSKPPRDQRAEVSPTAIVTTTVSSAGPQDNDAQVHDFVSYGDDVRLTKFLMAANQVGAQRCQDILEKHYEDKPTSSSETLMMTAARRGDTDIGRTLLRFGANPGLGAMPKLGSEAHKHATLRVRKDGELSTPMYLASSSGHAPFVRLLLEVGVPADDAVSALGCEVHTAVAATLLRHAPNMSIARFRPAFLAWLAEDDGHVRAERLLEAAEGFRPTLADSSGMLIAAHNLRPQSIHLLFAHGVRADTKIGRKEVSPNVWQNVCMHDIRSLLPMDVAIARAAALPKPSAESVRETIEQLVAAHATVTNTHVKKLITAADMKTFEFAFSRLTKGQAEVLESAIASGEVQKAALVLRSTALSSEVLEAALKTAQDQGFSRLFNLIGAKLSLNKLQTPAIITTSRAQKWRFWTPQVTSSAKFWDHFSGSGSEPHQDSKISDAEARFETLYELASAFDGREKLNPSLPPPDAANNQRQLILARRSEFP